MNTSPLLDALSEFLMVEQCGLQLYRVAASRSTVPDIRARYEAFLEETAKHREVLVGLIGELGGDPDYVSPTARLAQVKNAKLLESVLWAGALSDEERETNDLENVLLAETKDHADWSLLLQLAEQMPAGQERDLIAAAVEQVESEEDEHLEWARETLAARRARVIASDMRVVPSRLSAVVITDEAFAPLEEFHPRPIKEGLLDGSSQPAWQPSVISRSMTLGSLAIDDR